MASYAVTFSRSFHGASQEVEMGVTVEIEVGEVGNRVGRSVNQLGHNS